MKNIPIKLLLSTVLPLLICANIVYIVEKDISNQDLRTELLKSKLEEVSYNANISNKRNELLVELISRADIFYTKRTRSHYGIIDILHDIAAYSHEGIYLDSLEINNKNKNILMTGKVVADRDIAIFKSHLSDITNLTYISSEFINSANKRNFKLVYSYNSKLTESL